jgi:hypothetical protein
MTVPEGLTYERAAGRIGRAMAVIALLGTVTAAALAGWKAGLGFLLGSGLSALNFRWIKGLVDGVAGGRRRRTAILAFRYLILGAGAYVILRFIPVNPRAVLAGVFVFTAAVFVEVAFEIVYARK